MMLQFSHDFVKKGKRKLVDITYLIMDLNLKKRKRYAKYGGRKQEFRTYCNIRESIGNGFHTLDRMYTMYTYPSYDRLLSTIGLSLETGAREAQMNESGQLIIRTLVPSGPRKVLMRNS